LREKQLYALILVLAIALAGVVGCVIALVLPIQSSARASAEYGRLSEPTGVPIVYAVEGQEAQLRTIAVTGMGRASAKPNQAQLRLGARSQETTATETLAKNAESMNKVIGALKGMGIPEKDIETSYFSLYPRYSTYGETLIGFEATHMLSVTTTSLDKVGEIIDGAVEAGANSVGGVYFTFTEDKFQELNEQARQGAVEDAKAKAETIATSLAVKIIGVASATEETGYYPSPYYYPYDIAVIGASPPTPIMPPTEVEVTVTIRVTYIIE